jgi:hypothetical protein
MEPRRRIISLRGHSPLRSDEKLLTYAHPDHEDRVITVVNPRLSNWPTEDTWHLFRAARTRARLERELRRYRAVERNEPRHPPFIQQLFGMVETDLGRGLVAERLADPKDRPAPTLRSLVKRQGLTPEVREAARRFFGEITQRDLTIGELGVNNIVYASDRRGYSRLVLVNGLGSRSLLPFAVGSAARNRHRKIERLMAALAAVDASRSAAPRKRQTARG